LPTAVLVAPKFDDVTEYSWRWAQRLKEAIGALGWSVVELGGRPVSRAEVEDALSRNPGTPFVFEDHGSEDALWGSESEAVVDLKNVEKLAGRVIYTMACLSAKKLGATAYAQHNCIYIGYVREFAFTPYDEELFCRAANSGFIAYAKGESDWAKVKKFMVEAFNEAIARAEDPWTRTWLTWDRDALRVYAPNADQPEPACPFRKLAVRLLGPRVGWRISRRHGLALLLFGGGVGVYLHDRVAEWGTLHYRLHGLDVGVMCIAVSWAILSLEVVRWLRK
jgi:hypothetical protein